MQNASSTSNTSQGGRHVILAVKHVFASFFRRPSHPAHAARDGSCTALASLHAYRSGTPRITGFFFSLPFFSTLRAVVPSSLFKSVSIRVHPWFKRSLRNSAVPKFCLLTSVFCLLAPAVHAGDQYTPPPSFDNWLACTFYACGAFAAVAVAIRQIFPKRVPSIDQEFVTKAEFEHHCAERHCKLEKDLDAVRTSITSSETKREEADVRHEERSSNIHKRVDVLTKLTYRIAGKLNVNCGDIE